MFNINEEFLEIYLFVPTEPSFLKSNESDRYTINLHKVSVNCNLFLLYGPEEPCWYVQSNDELNFMLSLLFIVSIWYIQTMVYLFVTISLWRNSHFKYFPLPLKCSSNLLTLKQTKKRHILIRVLNCSKSIRILYWQGHYANKFRRDLKNIR